MKGLFFINNAVIDVINALCEKFGLAINWGTDFTVNQIMPFVQDLTFRYAKYEIIWSGIWAFVFLSVVILLVIFITKLIIGINDNTVDMDAIGVVIFLCTIALGLLIPLAININNLIMWANVPEIKMAGVIIDMIKVVK